MVFPIKNIRLRPTSEQMVLSGSLNGHDILDVSTLLLKPELVPTLTWVRETEPSSGRSRARMGSMRAQYPAANGTSLASVTPMPRQSPLTFMMPLPCGTAPAVHLSACTSALANRHEEKRQQKDFKKQILSYCGSAY